MRVASFIPHCAVIHVRREHVRRYSSSAFLQLRITMAWILTPLSPQQNKRYIARSTRKRTVENRVKEVSFCVLCDDFWICCSFVSRLFPSAFFLGNHVGHLLHSLIPSLCGTYISCGCVTFSHPHFTFSASSRIPGIQARIPPVSRVASRMTGI